MVHGSSDGSLEKKLCGEVEADETFVGGNVHLMNNAAKARKLAKGQLSTGGTVGKAIVMGILERQGEARVKVVADRTANSGVPEIDSGAAPTGELVADYAHEVSTTPKRTVKGPGPYERH